MAAYFKALNGITLFLLFACMFFLPACSKDSAINKKDIIAYVNKEPILASELKREIALRQRQSPAFKVTPEAEAEQLDTIINRKLIVQKAMEQGLAREDIFVNTIKAYWEQTLIRDFLEYKKKVFQDYAYITEDDIRKYYEDLSEKTTFKVIKNRDRRYVDDAYNRMAENRDVETLSCETIGPVGCEDMTSDVLRDARKMSEGDVKKFEDGPLYYAVKVEKKEKVALEPLEALRPEIEKRIRLEKERALFEDWLKSEKKKADIRTFLK